MRVENPISDSDAAGTGQPAASSFPPQETYTYVCSACGFGVVMTPAECRSWWHGHAPGELCRRLDIPARVEQVLF